MNEFFGLKVGSNSLCQLTDSFEKRPPPLALDLLFVLARSLT